MFRQGNYRRCNTHNLVELLKRRRNPTVIQDQQEWLILCWLTNSNPPSQIKLESTVAVTTNLVPKLHINTFTFLLKKDRKNEWQIVGANILVYNQSNSGFPLTRLPLEWFKPQLPGTGSGQNQHKEWNSKKSQSAPEPIAVSHLPSFLCPPMQNIFSLTP